jgi:hypothetical protein
MLSATVLGGACSATSSHSAVAGAGGASMSTSASTGSGENGGGITIDAGSGDVTCPLHCSSDLHSVLDCDGDVVTTCSADQGCGATGCVAACESAAENKSSVGCDFYVVDPDVLSGVEGSCFAAYIANTWDAPVTLGVERAGVALDATKFSYLPSGAGQSITYAPLPGGQLPPGMVAIVFLAAEPSSYIGCPAGVEVGYAGSDGAVYGTGMGHAYHITTSAPVAAYDIFPYGGGPAEVTSATLLLPSTSWEPNYIVVDGYQQSTIAAGATPSMDIVAASDATAELAPPWPSSEAAGSWGRRRGRLPSTTSTRGRCSRSASRKSSSAAPCRPTSPSGSGAAHHA